MSVDARVVAERVAEFLNRKVLGQVKAVESEVTKLKKELELWKDQGIKSAISAMMEINAKKIANEVAAKLYADMLTRETSTDELKEIGYTILERLNALSKAKPSVPPDLIKKLHDLSNGLSSLNDALNSFKTLADQKLSDFEKRLPKSPEMGDLKAVIENLSEGVNELRKQIKVTNRVLNEYNERLETIEQLLSYVHEVSGELHEEVEKRKRAGGEEE